VSVYRDLRLQTDNGVTTITLSRPEVRNALRPETYDELCEAVTTADARVLVVTGEDPAFCSGDDVRVLMPVDNVSERRPRVPALTPAASALLHTNLPVIAAVNGAAVGWGAELALLADFRIFSERAVIGEIFVRRGLVSDVAGLGRLVQLVGREKAAELLMTGDVVDAYEAVRIGLGLRVVPHEDLLAEAGRLARRIADNAPQAVQAIKEGLRRGVDPDWPALGLWVSATLQELFKTDDHHEGVRSFLEKRAPHFTGQ
jgi:enoyl-CoA hydratase/carnithine racemase